MQSSILSLLALGLAFCSPASAVYSYSTLSLCTTKFGLISAPVKSSGLSVTVPITYTQKTTLTPVSTVTPSPTSVFITNTITVRSIRLFLLSSVDVDLIKDKSADKGERIEHRGHNSESYDYSYHHVSGIHNGEDAESDEQVSRVYQELILH